MNSTELPDESSSAAEMAKTLMPLSEISSLSDSQERWLSVLSLCSGILSIMGSSMIVYLVIKNARKTPYKRILLGLSICDIIASGTYAFSVFFLPRETSQRVWASGNDRTCSILGFLTQYAFSAIWYNGMLSFYYLFTVRYGVKTETFSKRYEPIIHILCIGYNLGCAIIGLIGGFYSEAELGQTCWIAEYPEGCEATNTCTGATIGWAFGGLPTVIFFLSIIINNIVIYRYVRRTIQKTSTKNLRGSARQNQRIQAVATQAMLYVGTFLMAYVWAFSVKVAESVGVQAADEARIFPLLVLQALFLPMQGVFNLIVYSRPNYVRIRSEFPDEPWTWIVRRAWFGVPNRHLTSVDASLASNYNSSRPITNVAQARARAASQFTAVFSTKDPLRRDFRAHEHSRSTGSTSLVTFDLSMNQVYHSQASSLHDDSEHDHDGHNEVVHSSNISGATMGRSNNNNTGRNFGSPIHTTDGNAVAATNVDTVVQAHDPEQSAVDGNEMQLQGMLEEMTQGAAANLTRINIMDNTHDDDPDEVTLDYDHTLREDPEIGAVEPTERISDGEFGTS